MDLIGQFFSLFLILIIFVGGYKIIVAGNPTARKIDNFAKPYRRRFYKKIRREGARGLEWLAKLLWRGFVGSIKWIFR